MYASQTTVNADRSRAEIEVLLKKFGASSFGYWSDDDQAMIQFVYRGIRVQFAVPLPNPKDARFMQTEVRKSKRSIDEALRLYQKEVNRRWRALTLAIKAKLVAVEEGVFTFETEFMPHMITSDGRTIGQRMLPAIARAMETSGQLLLEAS
jgi:hypothetical protein